MISRLSIFLILMLMFGYSLGQAQNSFIEDFEVKWQNATAYTLEFAQSMPEDFYGYRPMPEEMTFGEQLKHIAGNMIWLSSSYLGGSKEHVDPSTTSNSKKEIISMLDKAFAYAGKTASGLSSKELDEKVEFIAGSMSRRRVLFLMTDHVTHHRGQLVVYLRLNHVDPPKYVGW